MPLFSFRLFFLFDFGAHQLSQREERSLALDVTGDEKATIRRLNIILSVKDAYIKAIGQPVGFDYSRIDCDVLGKRMTVDGNALSGWHIRMFNANLAPTPEIVTHKAPLHYNVAVAVFRGGQGMKFTFAKTAEELDQFVTFFDVKEVVNAVPRLGQYDDAGVPSLDNIPLSGKNSMASMSEEKREKMRERERKEVPPVPALPAKYAHHSSQASQNYTNDVKVSIPYQSSRSTSKDNFAYPQDVKHPLPPAPTPSSYVTAPVSSYTARGGIPIGPTPAPSYSSTKLAHQTHSYSHQPSSSGYSAYPPSIQHTQSYQSQNPIHTSRR